MVKKKTPEARAVLWVLDQIQYEENKPRAAKAADISMEKHMITMITRKREKKGDFFNEW